MRSSCYSAPQQCKCTKIKSETKPGLLCRVAECRLVKQAGLCVKGLMRHHRKSHHIDFVCCFLVENSGWVILNLSTSVFNSPVVTDGKQL